MKQSSVQFALFPSDVIQNGYYLDRDSEEGEMKKEEDLLRFTSWEDIYSSSTKYESSQGSVIKQQQFSFPVDSLHLLRNYATGFTKSKGQNNQNDGNVKISAEEIVRIAGERFICFTTQDIDHSLMATHPYGSSFSCVSIEELQDVDLAHLLLASADKVGRKQFDRASKLLAECEFKATDSGNPVQRIVYYFAQALRERIRKETRSITRRRINDAMGMSTNLVFLKFNQEIPFNQVMVSTGIQAILENVKKEKEIHLIDLQIRSGVQWTSFMQTLAERVSYPVKNLKITAIGTMDRQKMEETGKRLENLAKTLNLSFSYNIIFLSDMKDLRQEHFQMNWDERPVIYCPLILRTMLSRPECLEHLIGVFKGINSSMMVVTEVEANLNFNSPSFFNRFIETLFFYSAYFDCLEECTDRDNEYRNILEQVFSGYGIYNIVAAEGEERFQRSVKINVWGDFFKRFGIEQMKLSESSLYLASLHLKRFSCASFCTLEKKGESLLIGWKGTPIQSLSTWKFLEEEKEKKN